MIYIDILDLPPKRRIQATTKIITVLGLEIPRNLDLLLLLGDGYIQMIKCSKNFNFKHNMKILLAKCVMILWSFYLCTKNTDEASKYKIYTLYPSFLFLITLGPNIRLNLQFFKDKKKNPRNCLRVTCLHLWGSNSW